MRFFAVCFASIVFAASLFLTPVALTGCKSPSAQATAVKTLYSVGQTADAAFKAYLDSIVSGGTPTNSLPEVAKAYSLFQATFSAAVTAAAMNSNAVATVDVANASAQLLLTIQKAKGK